jgi:hypothetical protein
MGHLKRLPPEYKGERHIVIAKQLPNIGGQEWVEYEERPGPEPPQNRNDSSECGDALDIVFVAPYPRADTMPREQTQRRPSANGSPGWRVN